MKPKGVTTQMKALDEYFLMVVFMLLLISFHDFVIFKSNLNRETMHAVKGLTQSLQYIRLPLSLLHLLVSNQWNLKVFQARNLL